MPRRDPMSWEGAPYFRWAKMYKRNRLKVSGLDLGLPRDQWAEDGSRAAMRAWWRRKGVDIDGADALEPEVQQGANELGRKVAWAATHRPDLLPALDGAPVAVADLPTAAVADGLPNDDDDV